MTQLTKRLQGLAGMAAIVAFVVGVPAVLVAARTTPWTTDWGMVAQRLTMADNGTLLLTFLSTIAWIGWSYFAVSLAAEALARIRGLPVPPLRGFAVSQTVARRLFDVAALAFAAIPTLSVAASAPTEAAPAWTMSQPLEPAPHVDQPALPTDIAPVATTALTQAPAAQEAPRADEYTVRRGDNLWRIAEQRLGDGHRWSDIHRLNQAALGDDPDFITPGTVLFIPYQPREAPEPTAGTHLVQPGDTLSQIAADHLGDSTRYPEIFEASKDIAQPNGERLTDPNLIKPGWTVDISPEDQAPTTDPATEPTSARAGVPGTEAGPRVISRPEEVVPAPAPATEALAGPETTSPGLRTDEPQETRSAVPDDADRADDDRPVPAWFVPGLAGAGAVLGAGVFLTVRAHRRTQLRFRTPGHVIAPIPAQLLGPAETAHVAGGRVAKHVEALDRALRALASVFLDPSCYPPVMAVELTASRVTLHLASDVTLPAPWAGQLRTWSAPLHGEHTGVDMIPPYPMLVSVGQSDDGTLWLVNLEQLGTLAIHGDPDDVEAFARHVAAELAVGPWSFLVNVHVIGLAEDLNNFNSGRLTHTPQHAANALDDVASEVEVSRDGGDWDPEDLTALVLGPGAADESTAQRLATAIKQHASRPGVAVVAVNAEPIDGTIEAQITPGRHFRVEALGIDVQAALLTAEESAAVTELVAVTDTHENIPMPVDEDATEGLMALVDAGGAIRRHYVEPRPADDQPAGRESLLPDPATDYAADAPLTVEDVHQLAPVVSDDAASKVLAADPHLERDLDWWTRGSDCPVPRLVLLGKTDIHGLRADLAVSERKQHFAELATFLWTYPGGVRSSAVAAAFGCAEGRARTDITNLRGFFGERHVPKAPRRNQPEFERWNGYHLHDVLVDVDLFRRLRARGTALGGRDHNPDGIAYLARALELVQGEPFTDDRSGSWVWMHQDERIDHEIAAAIVDTALLVTAATLHANPPDLDTARMAAQTAIRTSPYDEPARLALAEVEDAAGNHAEADRLRRDGIFNRTDDQRAPLDPPSRSTRVGRKPRARQA